MTTVQQLADFFQWFVETGRGHWAVEIDMTSQLCVWQVCQMVTVAPSERVDEERKVVFVNAVLEA